MIEEFKEKYWYKLLATKINPDWDWNQNMNPILKNCWFKCLEGGIIHAKFKGVGRNRWNWSFCKHLFIESKIMPVENLKKAEDILKNWK